MADDASDDGTTLAAVDDEAATAHEALLADDVLGSHVAEHGPVELAVAEDPFRRLVVSVLRQQVSMDAAAAIRERLFDAVDPTPEAILAADETTLRDAGVSAAKTRYLRNLAEAWREEGWSREGFGALDDEAVRAELTAVTGVGPWTADMFLLFGLGRPDVFPVGDLGIRKGMDALFDADLTRAEMRDCAERWAPYRGYASLHLWRVVD
jgi:DNA-3-methyladenine glycosylase II